MRAAFFAHIMKHNTKTNTNENRKNDLGGVGKNTYTAPEMNVYELSADTGIMQMSSSIPGLGETNTTPGDAVWS